MSYVSLFQLALHKKSPLFDAKEFSFSILHSSALQVLHLSTFGTIVQMNIKIKLFDDTLPLPRAQSAGAAGIDLYSRVTVTIPSKQVAYIPLNIALEIPEGHWVLIAARGSTHKAGLLPINGIGVGDADFCGENDEYHFPAYNFTEAEVTVQRGQRICQMIVMPCQSLVLEHVDGLGNKDRGSFGSTGK